MISVYNNFINSEYSLGAILSPIVIDGIYKIGEGTYLPNNIYQTISHPDTVKQLSAAASNFQLLPNGNFLLHAGRQGRTMELTSDADPVWEYFVPMRNGVAIDQGDILQVSDNFTFSGRKYPADYIGFEDKDLSPKGYIELMPSDLFCNPLSTDVNKINEYGVFPNPSSFNITLTTLKAGDSLTILDVYGNSVLTTSAIKDSPTLNIQKLDPGIYIILSDKESYSFVKI